MAREHVHLIGIGGTGMTAVAGLLHAAGCRVTGSDQALYPPTSTVLQSLGLSIHEGYAASNLDPRPDLVVVGNAISRGNPEVEDVLDSGLAYTSMPRLVSERFLKDRHSIVVAGTHGKTTTSSMIAWILTHAGRDPGFLIGGQPLDLEHPFHLGRGPAFVIEGDEYDTAFFDKGPKFMHYRPSTAILGTVEFDHADIFRDLDEVARVFGRLQRLIPRRGLLVRHEDCALTRQVSDEALCRVEGFGLDRGGWCAVDMETHAEGCRFRLMRDGQPFADLELSVTGEHNVLNATAAAAVAHEQGLDAEEIRRALAEFKGVRRRLELRGEVDGIAVYDDFAHHPSAVATTLRTVRRRFPDRRIWAVLEPRSWSMRRNVFQEPLTRAFDPADEVIVAEVFRPEQVPEELRLDTHGLVRALGQRGCSARSLPGADAIVELLTEQLAPGDVLIVMSNGGFGGLIPRLLDSLSARVQLSEPEAR